MKTRMQRQRDQFDRDVIGTLASFCLDLAKLVFGGVILAGIMKLTLDPITLFVFGGLAVIWLMVLWYILLKRSKLNY